jgi:hypothetical protein
MPIALGGFDATTGVSELIMASLRLFEHFNGLRSRLFHRIRAAWRDSPGHGGQIAHADDAVYEMPAVTPYRPSVSTPAALSAPGWLEIEAGAITAGEGVDQRRALPYSLKLALSPDWGVRVDGEALVLAQNKDERTVAGFGDTTFVLKRRFAVNDRSAFGLEFQVGTVTTSPVFRNGSGRTDYTLNGIYSADIGAAYHADFNYAVTRMGRTTPGEGRDQTRLAAALSRTLGQRWSVVGELSGTDRAGVDRTEQLLLAASYTPASAICWDFGLARGLNAATPEWAVFAGVTLMVTRMF